MKAFYRHRIPESSCERKKTVDIDIFVTAKNGDRRIMKSIGIISDFKETEPVQSVQINIYQSNPYKRLKLTTFR